jgi:hypothetical protein
MNIKNRQLELFVNNDQLVFDNINSKEKIFDENKYLLFCKAEKVFVRTEYDHFEAIEFDLKDYAYYFIYNEYELEKVKKYLKNNGIKYFNNEIDLGHGILNQIVIKRIRIEKEEK